MKTRGTMLLLMSVVVSVLCTGARADVISSAQEWDVPSVTLPAAGSGDATGVVTPFYSIGKLFNGGYLRPFIPFANADFASIAGQTITSATLHLKFNFQNFEGTDLPFFSEVRMASTTATNITSSLPPEADQLATLLGDGGPHTAVNTVTFLNDHSTDLAIDLNAAGLAALEAAINGSDPSIVFALREFESQGDPRDDIAFIAAGADRPTLHIRTAPIPEPASATLLGVGSLLLLRRRRKCRGV